MRIKLSFDLTQQIVKRQKICFFVDTESCRNVGDLNYLIKKRFFQTSGIVSLFLDGFFIPPSENINIIQENDILTVK